MSSILFAVTWLKYCRYGLKLYPINQSINQSINFTTCIYERLSLYIRSRFRTSALVRYASFFTCSCTNFSEFIKAKKAILIINKNANITRISIQENSYFTSTLLEQLLTDSQIAINCRANVGYNGWRVWLHVFVDMLTLVQQ